jgi:hypothetical protein
MQLKLKLNPRQITARTQNEVLNRIRDRHLFSVGGLGNALTPYPGDRKDHVRVYSLEKRRKRVQRKDTKGGVITEVISRAHWVGHYYDIPASLLEAAGLKVIQEHRTFRIQKR